MADADDARQDLTVLTVDLLSAFVSNNNVRSEDLPGLIASTHSALAALDAPVAPEPEAEVETHVPAVGVRKSLADRDYILSLIDGKPYRSLKRHLASHGLTPATYRERYKLPASYPMVAPGYSEKRREVARQLGLGRKPRAAEPQPAAPPPVETVTPTAPAKAASKAAAKTSENVVTKPARKPRAAKAVVAETAAAPAKPKTARKPRAKLGIVTE
ncbi:MucR family transcriptional regulator [Sphingomonadaceae bacterium jetA1]|jgi:predicted transcriptional regulator|uniref:MucR family transcriptional regulator n=1 Tax=Facivitalis istanbulensis TaxID=3075838 RepID=UPI00346E0202